MRRRRAVLTRRGGPEAVEVVEDEIADPGPGEVQLRVLASGVAFGDVMKRRGFVPRLPPFPFTPGYDLAGVVERAGPGAGRLRPGERVAAFVMNGANADRANVPERLCVPVPPRAGDAQAAACVLNYVTAFQLLHRSARVRPAERILVHGAAGGVGTALLDLARLAGLEAHATASRGKHEVVRRFGGLPIDYRSEDFEAVVRRRTGEGVDAAFDPVGGAHLLRSRRALRRGGRLVSFGVSGALERGRREIALTLALVAICKLWPDGREARLYGIGGLRGPGDPILAGDLGEVLRLLGEGRISPLVGARLPLSEARRAHELVERGAVAGKVVLVS